MSRRFILALAGLAYSAVSTAAQQVISCPLWLPANSFVSKSLPGGDWVGLMPQEVRLSSGGMLHGSPEGNAYLAPTESKGAKIGYESQWIQRWQLDHPRRETWVYCGYGNDAVQLFKRVNDSTRQCSAISKSHQGAITDITFKCR
jgi:hypothetical protein